MGATGTEEHQKLCKEFSREIAGDREREVLGRIAGQR
jgi:hypothetical protein